MAMENHIEVLMGRFLAGEDLSVDEMKELEEFEKSQPLEFEEYKKVWELTALPGLVQTPLEVDEEKAWKKVESRLKNREAKTGKTAKQKWMVFTDWRTLSIAASFALLVVLGYQFFKQNDGEVNRMKTVLAKEDVSFELPDGSKVNLKKGSRLEYDSLFKEGRLLSLSGEGFFDVEPDAKNPFIIEMKDCRIRVLGTQFWVKNEEGRTELEVVEGRVEFGSNAENGEKTVLGANESARFFEDKIMLAEADQNKFAWKTGVLVFRNADISRISKVLSTVLEKEVSFDAKAQNNCYLSGKFSTQNKKELLFLLSQTTGLNFVEKGDTLLIEGQCE